MAVVWLFGCFVMLVLDAGGCDWSFGSGLVVLLLHDLSLYLVLMFRMFCVRQVLAGLCCAFVGFGVVLLACAGCFVVWLLQWVSVSVLGCVNCFGWRVL